MILKTKDGITGLRGKIFSFRGRRPLSREAPRAPESRSLFGDDEKPKNQRVTEVSIHLTDAEPPELAQIQVLPTYHPAPSCATPTSSPSLGRI